MAHKAFQTRVDKEHVYMVSPDDPEKILEVLPIVDASEQYRSFILSTWVRSYENQFRKTWIQTGPNKVSTMSRDVYLAGEPKLAEAMWHQSKVVTGIEDDFTVHAWVCALPGNPGALYHVYVSPELRGHGLGSGLVEAFLGRKYHVSKPAPFSKHHQTYNPYLNIA